MAVLRRRSVARVLEVLPGGQSIEGEFARLRQSKYWLTAGYDPRCNAIDALSAVVEGDEELVLRFTSRVERVWAKAGPTLATERLKEPLPCVFFTVALERRRLYDLDSPIERIVQQLLTKGHDWHREPKLPSWFELNGYLIRDQQALQRVAREVEKASKIELMRKEAPDSQLEQLQVEPGRLTYERANAEANALFANVTANATNEARDEYRRRFEALFAGIAGCNYGYERNRHLTRKILTIRDLLRARFVYRDPETPEAPQVPVSIRCMPPPPRTEKRYIQVRTLGPDQANVRIDTNFPNGIRVQLDLPLET